MTTKTIPTTFTAARYAPMETFAPSNEGESPTMPDYLSITESANQCGCPPPVLCNMFWRKRLDRSQCVRIAGRTLIPRAYFENIIKPMMLHLGYIPAK